MSTVALTRNPSKTAAVLNAVAELVSPIWRRFHRRAAVGRDMRTLQALPDYMLADIGLEKLEFRSAADGRGEIRVIPHRYY